MYKIFKSFKDMHGHITHELVPNSRKEDLKQFKGLHKKTQDEFINGQFSKIGFLNNSDPNFLNPEYRYKEEKFKSTGSSGGGSNDHDFSFHSSYARYKGHTVNISNYGRLEANNQIIDTTGMESIDLQWHNFSTNRRGRNGQSSVSIKTFQINDYADIIAKISNDLHSFDVDCIHRKSLFNSGDASLILKLRNFRRFEGEILKKPYPKLSDNENWLEVAANMGLPTAITEITKNEQE